MASLESIITSAALAEGFALAGFARLERLGRPRGLFRALARRRPRCRNGLAGPRSRAPPRPALARSAPANGYQPRLSICAATPADARLAGGVARTDCRVCRRVPIITTPCWRRRARSLRRLSVMRRPRRVRLYVDTGPILEREWAARARLGWFGRNTNLLNRYHGSYFFLAEILTDLRARTVAGAISRALRDLPPMPRSLSDWRADRWLSAGAAPVHLLSHDRASRARSRGSCVPSLATGFSAATSARKSAPGMPIAQRPNPV